MGRVGPRGLDERWSSGGRGVEAREPGATGRGSSEAPSWPCGVRGLWRGPGARSPVDVGERKDLVSKAAVGAMLLDNAMRCGVVRRRAVGWGKQAIRRSPTGTA